MLALYVLCTGMLMIILDGTIVNVALPSIQSDLSFSQSDLAWVVNAYLIPFGGLLLLSGPAGRPDRAQAPVHVRAWCCSWPRPRSAAWPTARRCWWAPASSRASAAH